MIARRSTTIVPNMIPIMRNRFLYDRLGFEELEDEDVAAAVAVVDGAAVVNVVDTMDFAKEKEEVALGEPVEEVVSVEEILDDSAVVVGVAESESTELSSESPRSSSCCSLFVDVAAAAVVVAAPSWAKANPYNVQNRATYTQYRRGIIYRGMFVFKTP
jgi:nucleotide-binding universal stress UspA family protein